ncbi:MAG TPA: hypothetical protein VJN70_04915, partial [Gemmatimonadaceae bacterium]|nr:hypothetical protein [Gemmatimonadaceae bacterium]
SPPPSIATGLRLEILNVNNLATDILRTHQINVRLAGDSAPASLSAVFTADTAVARLRDGTVLVLPATMGATLRIPDPPLEAPVRWLGAPLNSLTMDRIGVPLHGNTVSAVARGLVSLEIQGRLSLMRPRVFARVPLREGEQINSDGMRVRIARVAHELGQTSVELETASVGDPGGGIRARAQSFFGGVDRPSYVMLNPGRGEAVALFNRNSGGGADWLVLPGTSIRQSTMRLQPNDAPGLNGQFAPDDAWYGNAQLLIVEWIPAGEYRARVSAQVH